MVSLDLLNLFPHDSIRDGQRELVEDLEKVFQENKTLIAHAPTGLGKTASALTVALSEALKHKKKIFFLTNRHTQHKIAVDTLKKIKKKTGKNIFCVDLIGKRWMCNQEISGVFGNDFNEFCKSLVEKSECEFYTKVKQKKGLTVDAKVLLKDLQKADPMHNEELVLLGKEKSMCSYEIALALAKNANVLIGDYYYMFNPFVMSNLFAKLELEMEDVILIVDEGHNLPSRVTDMLSNSLTSNMLMNAVVEAKKFSYNGVIFWLQELNRILNKVANFTEDNKEILIKKEQFVSEVKKIVDYDELINELEVAANEIRKKQKRSYLGGIANFLEIWQGEDEGFTRILSEQRGRQGTILVLNYSCLDPAIITKDVFAKIHAGVVMSGTLNPTFMYKDLLSIEKAVEKEYNSPFPVENKLNLIVPETSTKYTLRGEVMFKLMAKKCMEMVDLIPGNVAIFFPSYVLRDKVGQYIESDKKLFWEKSDMGKEEKENLLNRFKAERLLGGVLLGVTGANFAEGIDFPGDLLNGVIVVGLPLARPSLKTKEIMKYYDQKFGRGWDYGYIYPAISKCLQSSGRCIRSAEDKGAVIYLDERFAWKNYYDCFPSEGLIVTKNYGKLLKEFFRKCWT
jgi:DNA excision repair protein ERCC-2